MSRTYKARIISLLVRKDSFKPLQCSLLISPSQTESRDKAVALLARIQLLLGLSCWGSSWIAPNSTACFPLYFACENCRYNCLVSFFLFFFLTWRMMFQQIKAFKCLAVEFLFYNSYFSLLSEQAIVGLLWLLVGASPCQKTLLINHDKQYLLLGALHNMFCTKNSRWCSGS